MMTGDEIREAFLKYFEEKGHARVRSSPLLPANDPTLLFTNAGMNQFKDVFLGNEKREYVRAGSSQKCIRAGGKHNDLDEVGKTARHHTFFEMLGNFSFGDYFKREAIQYALDLLLNVYKLPLNRLWFSVYLDDDDAARLWEEAGAPPDRILRFDEKDNFWQMGDTGPCGPCSEIHYYMGEDPDDPTKNRADLVNGPGDDTIEIWNLVFMQYERSLNEAGEIVQTPLPKPSVDTGAGLERLAVVLQDVKSNYDTDLLRPIIDFTAKLSDRNYEPETSEGFAMRVIADHARATAFAIADGILPGNEGRNYVLRKIMRRGIYQGHHTLGFEGQFFNQVTNFVVDLMKENYPELESHREFIEKMVRLEEERFQSTLTVGLSKLDELFASTRGQMPEYKALARLYDTFGTPRDLIRVSLEERGFVVAEDDFNQAFDAALQELQHAGAAEKGETKAKTNPVYAVVAAKVNCSVFRGYETTSVEDAKVVALLKNEEVDRFVEGEEGEVVFDNTPFYAESGGQVGDVGELVAGSGDEFLARVIDTYSPTQGLIVHKVRIERGELKVGDVITARVDVEKRDATRRNHTATHLMHAALREVLGTHVKQAGSVVAPTYLRFDFTHYQPLTQNEIEEIERLVNYYILRNEPVQTDVMVIDEAMRSGAMALFGEKYGERVRVLSIKGIDGIFSKELCGGTHVRATGDIGLFKITSDESIASGIRRIRAITGFDAYERFRETEILVDEISNGLRASRNDLLGVVTRLQEDLKKARREAEELRLKIASGAVSAATNGDESRDVAGVRVIAREATGLDAAGMRQLSDTLLARIKSGVVVLGRSTDGKVSLIVRTSSDLTSKIPAGQVIKELAPLVGGRGGGKADMAEGGGTQPEKLEAALQASFDVVERLASQRE